MSKVITVLKNKWFIQGMGLLVLFLLIWFVGPAIAVFEHHLLAGVASRLLLIVLITGLWLGNIFRLKYLSQKNNDEMVEALGQSDIEGETDQINHQFDDALKRLSAGTKNKKGTAHLYELPWYIIIGPPGSGKTTALVNSGLHFPLEGEFGKESLKGIGGTRHCDWWFTDEAVLIDTAGRFTTQDSHESVDKAAWQKFMDLLKHYRKQRPINGALIAVSITDISALSDHQRANYAHIIRSRIDELSKQLGICFPVYFIFTKCDLIAGFSEFFAHLNTDERDQVWGETFALDSGKNSEQDNGQNRSVEIEDYPQHFEQLLTRLKGQLLSRVNEELDMSLRPAVLGFPAQMRSLKEPISLFLSDVFSGNRYQQSALLRGVYFTSGTQEGTPLDRLLGNMATNWGIKAITDSGYHNKGRSYFLRRLLQEVIFPEAELAGVDQQIVKRRRLWQQLGFFTAAASLVLAITFWLISYQQNLNHIIATENYVTTSRQQAIEGDLVGTDFRRILPELNAMRAAAEVFDGETMLAHAGLYQGDDLGLRADKAYLSLLENKLLPMIAAQLQQMIITLTHEGDTTVTYEVLKAYLMYAGFHQDAGVERDVPLLADISKADWQQTFAMEPAMADDLVAHHRYLLEHGKTRVRLNHNDDKIVVYARKGLRSLPLSQQVYQSVKQHLLQDHSKDLSFTDMAGNLGSEVFSAKKGQPLAGLAMPGMFTKVGFYKNFLIQYETQANDYLTNNWVLGQQNGNKMPIVPGELKQQVYRHYYDDYAKHWGDLLKAVKLTAASNITQGLAIADSMTSLGGPMETLINTVASQTNLSKPLPTGKAAQGVADGLGVVSGSAQRVVSKISQVARATNKTGVLGEFGKPVTAAFQDYHRLVQSKSGQPLLARMMDESSRFTLYLQETLGQDLSEAAALSAVKKKRSGTGDKRFGGLRREINAMPTAVSGWLIAMSRSGMSMILQKSHQELNQIWLSEVVDFYDQAIKGRYPLDIRSKTELELQDFADFFRPKGVIDLFIDQHLSAFINMKSRSWQQKSIEGQTLPLSGSTIGRLYNARQITRLFFSRNGLEPKIRFSLQPVLLDATLENFRLNFGRQQIVHAHNKVSPVDLSWPLPRGQEETKIQFKPFAGDPVGEVTKGPWSLFKMLDLARLRGQGSIYRVKFAKSGFNAEFELRAYSEFNPLGARLLQNFTLPREL